MAVGHVLRHFLAGDDVVGGSFGFSTELHEHVVMVLGAEVLRLVGQDPALVPVSGGLALDRDSSLGLSVGGQDIDATGVAHRDRGDEATSGKLSRDEIFAGYSGKLSARFQGQIYVYELAMFLSTFYVSQINPKALRRLIRSWGNLSLACRCL